MTENRENKDKPEQPEKQKKGIKKKIRRSKQIKNKLRNFKIYYQNVRGLKSKTDSLAETIDHNDPTLICLVEPWYKIFSNDGATYSRGILIAIKEKLKTIVVEVNREDKIGQTLWMLSEWE